MPVTPTQQQLIDALIAGSFDQLDKTPRIQDPYTLAQIYSGILPASASSVPPSTVAPSPASTRVSPQTSFPVVPATVATDYATPMDIQASMRLAPSPPGYGPDSYGSLPPTANAMGYGVNTQGTGALFPNGQAVAAINAAAPTPPLPRIRPPVAPSSTALAWEPAQVAKASPPPLRTAKQLAGMAGDPWAGRRSPAENARMSAPAPAPSSGGGGLLSLLFGGGMGGGAPRAQPPAIVNGKPMMRTITGQPSNFVDPYYSYQSSEPGGGIFTVVGGPTALGA